MTKTTTQNIYHERIQRVIDYIHEHLDNELSLEMLASYACFSAYHFHRIYHAMTGETIKQTIRRLRLQKAAKALIDTDLPLEKIAKKAEYENTDSFIRKFKEDFSIPPNAYRKRGKLILKDTKNPTKESKTRYIVDIKTLDNIPLATLNHQGNYLEIGKTFEKLLTWGAHQNLITNKTRIFGLYYDCPTAIHPKDLRSKAGFTLPNNFEAEKDKEKNNIIPFTLLKGKYAVIHHKGPYSELHTAYQWLYGTWLPNSAFIPDDKPVIEEYLNNPREVQPSELLTAIYLPLKAS